MERVARELVARLPRLRPGRYRVIRPPRVLAHRAGHLWEQAWLLGQARWAALIYCPANLAPLAGDRNAVVIHDVAAARHPEWYGRTYATWQRTALPLIARRARLVIAPSEFSRGEILDVLGAAPERVAVVPNGVDERFNPDADPAPARAAHALERPYVLTVGTRIARKNLAALRTTGRALAERGIELVAAGSGRGYMRSGTEATPGVRPLGYVADQHLPGLYAGALAFVLPSLYEGFGIPCLEAMASGTPVVAANAGALPETCGNAALLVDPRDERAIADAVLEAATDERDRLARAGRERAAAFSWHRAAQETDHAIERAL